MQDSVSAIWEQLDASSRGRDVFAYWEHELEGRRRVRAVLDESGRLQALEPQREVLDFLFRALFPTAQRRWFYEYILDHSRTMPVIKWITTCPAGVKGDFLHQVPGLLRERDGCNLDFLVSIYDDAWQEDYRHILAVLQEDELNRLMGRTANPRLRRLLRERREQMVASRKEQHLGLDPEGIRLPEWNNMFGNKLELAREVLRCLQSKVRDVVHPWGYERFLELVEAVRGLYRLGWLEDSLMLFLQVYRDFQMRGRMAHQNQVEDIWRQMEGLARVVVPCYGLVELRTEPYREVKRIYREHLGSLSPDAAALTYLWFYQEIEEAWTTPGIYPRSSIREFCRRVGSTRTQDQLVNVLEAMEHGGGRPEAMTLLATARERLKPRPHEALVILELVRWLVERRQVDGKLELVCETLLEGYLDLWRWVPSRVFFRRVVLESIRPGLCADSRRRAESVLRWVEEPRENLLEFYRNKPDLAKSKDNLVALEAVIGQLMGVR